MDTNHRFERIYLPIIVTIVLLELLFCSTDCIANLANSIPDTTTPPPRRGPGFTHPKLEVCSLSEIELHYSPPPFTSTARDAVLIEEIILEAMSCGMRAMTLEPQTMPCAELAKWRERQMRKHVNDAVSVWNQAGEKREVDLKLSRALTAVREKCRNLDRSVDSAGLAERYGRFEGRSPRSRIGRGELLVL